MPDVLGSLDKVRLRAAALNSTFRLKPCITAATRAVQCPRQGTAQAAGRLSDFTSCLNQGYEPLKQPVAHSSRFCGPTLHCHAMMAVCGCVCLTRQPSLWSLASLRGCAVAVCVAACASSPPCRCWPTGSSLRVASSACRTWQWAHTCKQRTCSLVGWDLLTCVTRSIEVRHALTAIQNELGYHL